MERIDRFHPDIARDHTRVLQLLLDPARPVRTVALVEYFEPDGDDSGPRAMLCPYDLNDREELTRLVVDLSPTHEEAEQSSIRVRHHEDAARGLRAELLRAIVEGLMADEDYDELLRDHQRVFSETAARAKQFDLPERELLERVGRNEPCPCGSGRKAKKCCLRQLRRAEHEMPDHYELSLRQFRADWRERAEHLEGVNQLLEALWAILSAGDAAPRLATRLLSDMGITVDRDAIVAAVDEVDSVHDFPRGWRGDFASGWTWQRPLAEVVLPLLAEILWESDVPERPRPHRIKSCIRAGYELRSEPDRQFAQWARGWDQLSRWLRGREEPTGPELIEGLNEALDLSAGVDAWLADLLELARDRAGEVDGEIVSMLADIAAVFEEAAPRVANDADVFRYAALVDAGRDDEAHEVLEVLRRRPLADHSAALYLCDLFTTWEYDAPDEQLELVGRIAERSLQQVDDEQRRDQLREARRQLRQLS